MAQISNENEYNVVMERIEELLLVVSNDTPKENRNLIELELLSVLVAEYEEEHYPVGIPSLVDVIKLRMHEMNLTQKKLSDMLGISPSRVSEILTGKSEPTLQVARNISKSLHIDAGIVLGV